MRPWSTLCFRSGGGVGEVRGQSQDLTESRRCSSTVVELLSGNHQEAIEESLSSKCLGIFDCDDLFCIYSELWPRIWGFVKCECKLQQSLGLLWLTTETQLCRTSRNILVQCVTNIGITLFKQRLSDALQRRALFHLNKKPTNLVATVHLPSNPGVFCKPVNICWCIRYDWL